MKKHKCDLCGKSFGQKGTLDRHKTSGIHSNEKNFECEFCQKRFGGMLILNSHVKNIHYKSSERHQCKICPSTFSLLGDLKVHVDTIHNGNKKFKCDPCGKSFTRLKQLECHMKSQIHLLNQNESALTNS